MAVIKLHSKNIHKVTFISDRFIDEYMPGANGDYVKVYIYLMKCLQKNQDNISASFMADLLELTESDIRRAMKYWERSGLLVLSYARNGDIDDIEITDEFSGSEKNTSEYFPKAEALHDYAKQDYSKQDYSGKNSSSPDSASDVSDYSERKPAAVTENYQRTELYSGEGNTYPTQKRSTYTEDEKKDRVSASVIESESDSKGKTHDSLKSAAAAVPAPAADTFSPDSHPGNTDDHTINPDETETLAKDKDFRWICDVIQIYLQRPMNSKEMNLVSYLYLRLGFSQDLILHLYEYCISLGKTSVSYIQAVALSWHSKGIHTVEQAKADSAAYNAAYSSVARTFALNRSLSPAEKKYVDKWQGTYHMDTDIICEACSRTILNIQKPSFQYADGILDNWKKNGISSMRDIKKADEQFAAAQQKARKPEPQEKRRNYSQSLRPNDFTSFPQRNMSADDIDALERKLLNTK